MWELHGPGTLLSRCCPQSHPPGEAHASAGAQSPSLAPVPSLEYSTFEVPVSRPTRCRVWEVGVLHLFSDSSASLLCTSLAPVAVVLAAYCCFYSPPSSRS